MKRLFFKSEKGQSLTEYLLIMALVAIVAIFVMLLLGPPIKEMFKNVPTEREQITYQVATYCSVNEALGCVTFEVPSKVTILKCKVSYTIEDNLFTLKPNTCGLVLKYK